MPSNSMSNDFPFCPVAIASELVCKRLTPLILRELLQGSSRYSEIRRGLPRISSALLAERLRELERFGLLVRNDDNGSVDYRLTEAGQDLRLVVEALGAWGHRWAGPSEMSVGEMSVPNL